MRLLPRRRSCDLWLDFEVFTFCVVLDEPICMSLFYEFKGEDQFMNDKSRAMSRTVSAMKQYAYPTMSLDAFVTLLVRLKRRAKSRLDERMVERQRSVPCETRPTTREGGRLRWRV